MLAAFELLPPAQPPGDLDITFDIDGKVLTNFDGSNDEIYAVDLQLDGIDLVVSGYTIDLASGETHIGPVRSTR